MFQLLSQITASISFKLWPDYALFRLFKLLAKAEALAGSTSSHSYYTSGLTVNLEPAGPGPGESVGVWRLLPAPEVKDRRVIIKTYTIYNRIKHNIS